jgi:hypothetical protein
MYRAPSNLSSFRDIVLMGRLTAAAAFLTREMTQDVPIKVARPAEKTIVLKKGALMVIDMIAVRAYSTLSKRPCISK